MNRELWEKLKDKRPFDLRKRVWGARYIEYRNPLKRFFQKIPDGEISVWDERFRSAIPPKGDIGDIQMMIRVIRPMIWNAETDHELFLVRTTVESFLRNELYCNFSVTKPVELEELAWSIIASVNRISREKLVEPLDERAIAFNIAWACFESDFLPKQYEFFKSHLTRMSF